ncbi:MAG: Flp family type IVb pilin [Sphingomonadaceae bacterium]|jgi:pilus assembly protein Flp/PilA|nr:Flp family type IVb pilin [Sphingomonadaceae bacterium]
MSFIKNLLKDESGAAAAEYALIIAVVGVGIVGALGTLKGGVTNALNKANNTLTNGS